jgi:hypothetical protein
MGRGNGSVVRCRECRVFVIHGRQLRYTGCHHRRPCCTVCRVPGGVRHVHCGRQVRHVILYFYAV